MVGEYNRVLFEKNIFLPLSQTCYIASDYSLSNVHEFNNSMHVCAHSAYKIADLGHRFYIVS